MAADFGLEEFKQSPLGERVRPMMESRLVREEMKALSRHEVPALKAVGMRLAKEGVEVADPDKTLLGRWVRQVMGEEGWKPEGSKRIPPGNAIGSGALYVPSNGEMQLL